MSSYNLLKEVELRDASWRFVKYSSVTMIYRNGTLIATLRPGSENWIGIAAELIFDGA